MSRTGTVSHILWHFTGGNREGGPKPIKDSFEILKAILISKTLKRGSQKETLSFNSPLKSDKNGVTWNTGSVVCLADIPIQSLSYHASHYGRVAIGFKRQSAIQAGFTPVLYCSDKSAAMLKWIKIKRGSEALSDYLHKSVRLTKEIDSIVSSDMPDVHVEIVEALSSTLKGELEDFERLFKNYSLKAEHSAHIDRILNEREWRLLNDYKFDIDDISMIIVPEADGLYEELVSNRSSLGISNTTVIVPWETLNIS
jgi:hypothetical protein